MRQYVLEESLSSTASRWQRRAARWLAAGIVAVLAIVPVHAQEAFLSGAITFSEKTLFVIDTDDNSRVAQLQPSAEVTGYGSLAFGPLDDAIFLAPTTTQQLEMVRTTPPHHRFFYPLPSFPKWLDVLPDGQKAYVSTVDGLVVVDLATTETELIVPTSAAGLVEGVAVSPDGSVVYVAASGNARRGASLIVVDAATDRVLDAVRLHPERALVQGVAVAPDGGTVYVGGFQADVLFVVDPVAGAVVAEVETAGSARLPTLDATGARLYVSHSEGVALVDTATNRVVREVALGDALGAIDVHPDGDRVLTLDIGGELYVLDATTLETLDIVETPAANLFVSNEFIAPLP